MTAFETAGLIIAGANANATATAIRLEAAASSPPGREEPARAGAV